MKRFAVSLISSVLAFTAGLVTASSWNSKRHTEVVEPFSVQVQEPCAPTLPQAPATVQSSLTVTPPREFDFAQGRLKLVPEQVKLKSESLNYNIDVSYPQIIDRANTENPNIRKINKHLKEVATNLYQWALNPAKPRTSSFYERFGDYKNVNFTYDVSIATDSFLSLSFIGYSYGSAIDDPVQQSFAMNLDLISGKPLQLSDIFKSGSNYLEFISHRSFDELSKKPASLITRGLAPTATNFKNWHITSSGISFDFAACQVFTCAEGDQSVHIPYSDLELLLNPNIPGKFKITYP